MNTHLLSTGDIIVVSKIESISEIKNKSGFKGSLFSFVIRMDSGKEFIIENTEIGFLKNDQEYLLSLLKKEK